MENWCTNFRLTIYIDKTQVSKFGRSSKESEYFLGNQKLNVVNSFKFFGVVVDNKLCFKQHIGHVCKMLAKLNGNLYKARKVFSRKILLGFYQVFAKLLLSYGFLVYGCASKTNINKKFFNRFEILF